VSHIPLSLGIRNFLTLFLSIEVTKAMREMADAKEAGDEALEKYAETMVNCFTDQLNEANPILTEISDAMTEEGFCKEQLSSAMHKAKAEEAAEWKSKMEAAAERKECGNEKLMQCSARYNSMMKSFREERARKQQ
jgi:hypothetical protein